MSATALSVAAFLPARLLTHLKHVFADEPELLVATSWQELESFIRRKPVNVVILDPSADGTLNVSAVAGLLKRYPSLPLIAYVTLHAPAFKAIAQLGRLGLEDVVLHRFDDAPDRFLERIEQVQGNSLTHRVIEELHDSLRQLPRQLYAKIENMFDQPHRYSSVLDLALPTRLPSSTCFDGFGRLEMTPRCPTIRRQRRVFPLATHDPDGRSRASPTA